MPLALLEGNVLFALLDPRHVHHEPADLWIAGDARYGWATFALTQNPILRILNNPRYPNSPGVPAAVMPLLESMLEHPGHVFLPDSLSWIGHALSEPQLLLHQGQITDTF